MPTKTIIENKTMPIINVNLIPNNCSFASSSGLLLQAKSGRWIVEPAACLISHSPQYLHFTASARISSAQNGHFFVAS